MAKDNTELGSKLVQHGGQMTPEVFEGQMRDWFRQNSRRMITLAGSQEEANRIMATMMYVVQRTPKLLTCTQHSIAECLLHSAALKLYPGPMGECAYVPYKGQATFVPMYPGLTKLAYNTGLVKSINSNVVYSEDVFDWEEGSKAFLRHKPKLDEDRGSRLAAWCVVETAHGAVITVKSFAFIESIRKKAPFGNSPDSPWATDWDAMAVKTVLKQGLKTIPKSTDLATAIDLDNAAERPELVKAPLISLDASKVVGGAKAIEAPPLEVKASQEQPVPVEAVKK